MTGNGYQNMAMRTNDRKNSDRLKSVINKSDMDVGGIVNAALGLSGEVGELNDMLKKHIFHESGLEKVHFKKEIGDICWYVALMCESAGFSLDEIMQINIDKLKARYPDGFDVYKANNRKAGDM